MPNGPRIRANNVYGVISDNPLTAAAATFNSVSLPLLPVVAVAHAIIVFDPKRVYGDPEIVVVTAHTAASTVATVLRGQYGTSQRLHPQGTSWAHVPINEDWTQILTSITRPADPYRGQTIFETDTNRYVGRSTADAWQQIGLFFDPPACRVTHNVTQSHASNGNWQAVAFNTESFDTLTMHDTVTNNSRINISVAGLYVVQGSVEFATGTGTMAIGFRVNGTGTTSPTYSIQGHVDAVAQAGFLHYGDVIKLAVSDWVELVALQNSGGALNLVASTAEGRPNFSVAWIGRGN
jgi:hypothetical protein